MASSIMSEKLSLLCLENVSISDISEEILKASVEGEGTFYYTRPYIKYWKIFCEVSFQAK